MTIPLITEQFSDDFVRKFNEKRADLYPKESPPQDVNEAAINYYFDDILGGEFDPPYWAQMSDDPMDSLVIMFDDSYIGTFDSESFNSYMLYECDFEGEIENIPDLVWDHVSHEDLMRHICYISNYEYCDADLVGTYYHVFRTS